MTRVLNWLVRVVMGLLPAFSFETTQGAVLVLDDTSSSIAIHERTNQPSRQLQDADVCQALLETDDPVFQSCNCRKIASATYNVTCNDFCQLCLDRNLADLCIQYSFSTLYELNPVSNDLVPTLARTTQVQTGKNSSNSRFTLEEKFYRTSGSTMSCQAWVNHGICNACVTASDCKGLVMDCTNQINFPVFDECNKVQVDKMPLDSVFVGRNTGLFNIQRCSQQVATNPPPFLPPPPAPSPNDNFLPPKKVPPDDDDDSKDESKLFGEEERGNLNRRLASRRNPRG